MTADEYAQEFECSCQASVKGAIYATELETARAANRMYAIKEVLERNGLDAYGKPTAPKLLMQQPQPNL